MCAGAHKDQKDLIFWGCSVSSCEDDVGPLAEQQVLLTAGLSLKALADTILVSQIVSSSHYPND